VSSSNNNNTENPSNNKFEMVSTYWYLYFVTNLESTDWLRTTTVGGQHRLGV
jgi:hypothetical protein